MKRRIRNLLSELFLDAFDDPGGRAAIARLMRFCEIAARRNPPEVFWADLRPEGLTIRSGRKSKTDEAFARLVGPDKLLRFRSVLTGETLTAMPPPQAETLTWIVQVQPEVRTDFPEVCERVRIYAEIVTQMGETGAISAQREPLRKALAEAAMCFNVGLFFEAHEHLEHHWAALPKGPMKRYLQGIIQISVGFHHARSGNYHGTVSQLAKGLAKTLGPTGETLGLDCDTFLPEVAAAREEIVRRGPAAMRPVPLAAIPRMPIRG